MWSDFKSQGDELQPREITLLERSILLFASKSKYLEMFLDIISSKSRISIRVVDWFVSNYAKTHNVQYAIKTHGTSHMFQVSRQYAVQMNAYKKKYFDSFCRKKKVIVQMQRKNNTKIKFYTSVGQLNFFQWAIKNKVILFISRHIESIEQDMKNVIQSNKEESLINSDSSPVSSSIHATRSTTRKSSRKNAVQYQPFSGRPEISLEICSNPSDLKCIDLTSSPKVKN